MSLKFNINRPKISDEEIKQHQDFDKLVKQFKEKSIKQAQGDESWRKNKKVQYSAVIAGVTVICIVTLSTLFKDQKQKHTNTHEALTTKTNSRVSPPSKAFISEPSKKLSIHYSTYSVNNAEGGVITHSGASKIKVPKNSFVDKQGRDIVGDVTIEYKEFHDLGDVVASGIPMAYDSAGIKRNLETAGMFDIRGTQNGEAVFIKPGKKLEVELASRTNENRFNQYYLDTLQRNWQYIKKDDPKAIGSEEHKPAARAVEAPSSTRLIALKNQVEVVLPKKIDSVKVIYVKKAEKLPVPKSPAKPAKATGRPVFSIDANTTEFPELQAFDHTLFEVGDENKNYTKELHDITWNSVSISQGPVKGKNYLLTLKYRNRQENLVVYPVLSADNYRQAEAAYNEKLSEYTRLYEKRKAEEQRLMKEMEAKQAVYLAELKKKEEEYKAERARQLERSYAEGQNALTNNFSSMNDQTRAMRIFSVSRFGIYNSDCPHTMPKGVSVDPVFVANQRPVFPEAVYLVDHGLKTVYNLNPRDGVKLTYDPANVYSLCIVSGGKLYLCPKADFKQTANKSDNHFKVTPLPDNADNLPDFKKALEI